MFSTINNTLRKHRYADKYTDNSNADLLYVNAITFNNNNNNI